MDDRTEFDDFFKEQFEGYEGDVNQGAWKKLSDSLQYIAYNAPSTLFKKGLIGIMLLGSSFLLTRDSIGAFSGQPENSDLLSSNTIDKRAEIDFKIDWILPGNENFSEKANTLKPQSIVKNENLVEEVKSKNVIPTLYPNKVLIEPNSLTELNSSGSEKFIPRLSKKSHLPQVWEKPEVPLLSDITFYSNESVHTIKKKSKGSWRPFVIAGISSNYQTPAPNTEDFLLVSFDGSNTWNPTVTSWNIDLGINYGITPRLDARLGVSFQRVEQNIDYSNHYLQNYEISSESQVNNYTLEPIFQTSPATTSIELNEIGLATGLGYRLFEKINSPQLNLFWNTYLFTLNSSICDGENAFDQSNSITNQVSIGIEIPTILKFSVQPQITLGLDNRNFNGPFNLVNRSVGLSFIWRGH